MFTNFIMIMNKLIKPDILPPVKKVLFLQKCGSLVVGFLEVRKQLPCRKLLVSTARIQVRTGSYFYPMILFPCINTHFVSWMGIQYILDVFDWSGRVTSFLEPHVRPQKNWFLGPRRVHDPFTHDPKVPCPQYCVILSKHYSIEQYTRVEHSVSYLTLGPIKFRK